MVRLVKAWMIGMVVLVLGHPETLEAQFLDVPQGVWYEGAVSNLEKLALIEGYAGEGGRYFRPAQLMSRAEFLRLCLRALVKGGLRNFLEDHPDQPPFPDVPVDAWFAPDAAFAKEWGVIDRELTAFEPHRAITRSEAAEMISRTREPVPIRGYQGFSDVSAGIYHIRRAYEAGIVDGYGDGTFRPSRTLNRAEAVVMIERAYFVLILPPVIGLKMSVFSPHVPFLPEEELEPALDVTRVRLNSPDSADNLVRVEISGTPAEINTGVRYFVRRSHPSIRVWRERERTSPSLLGPADEQEIPEDELRRGLTLWVESIDFGDAELIVEARRRSDEGVIERNRATFRVIHSIVVVLGGWNQEPELYDSRNPLACSENGCGIFALGEELYRYGYDVWLFDEEEVNFFGYGGAYDAVRQAVEHRGVQEVAIIGYSWGGGSVNNLASALERDGDEFLGNFALVFTSYVDAVSSYISAPEYGRPSRSLYHLNQFQVHASCYLLLPCGGPTLSVPGAVTRNIYVTDEEWGRDLDHTKIDDHPLVAAEIISAVKAQVRR